MKAIHTTTVKLIGCWMRMRVVGWCCLSHNIGSQINHRGKYISSFQSIFSLLLAGCRLLSSICVRFITGSILCADMWQRQIGVGEQAVSQRQMANSLRSVLFTRAKKY